jgi:gluconate 2-dehydrogenase gamma chain
MTDLPGRPSRRSFLKGSAVTATLAGLSLPTKAQPAPEPVPLDQVEREYLEPAEWAFVMAACARLIPSEGDGPGAIECRVPVFIDRQLAGDFGAAADWYMAGPHNAAADPLLGWQTPLTPAEIYRQAIPVVDGWCQDNHGAAFAELDADTQDSVLTALDGGDLALAPEIRGFFTLIWQNTREGYFADPMYGGNHGMQAWVYIGFPGARGSYLEWVNKHNVEYPLGPVSISGERA